MTAPSNDDRERATNFIRQHQFQMPHIEPDGGMRDDLAALIAEVRNALPALLDAAERLAALDLDSHAKGAREQGRAVERAAIVAWLRSLPPAGYERDVAAAIERGAHLAGEK